MAGCQSAVDDGGGFVRSGEGHTRQRRMGEQDLAKACPIAGQEMKDLRRNTGGMQELYRLEGDERRLLGGLGDCCIASRQRGRDLTGKDRQRKIPRPAVRPILQLSRPAN